MADVIVDVGTNWDPTRPEESWREALIAAKEVGARYCKGQDWHPLDQISRPDEWKKRCAPWTLTSELLPWIVGTADELGISFYCSVFTRQSVRRAARLWYPFVKFASSEAANDDLLREHSGTGKPAMVSFGETRSMWRRMLTLATLNAWGQVIPFVCVAEYPTPTARAVIALGEITDYTAMSLACGWSSHVAYEDDAVGIARQAVKNGAAFVEVHMRLDSTPEDAPDNNSWSLYPWQVEELVVAVKSV